MTRRLSYFDQASRSDQQQTRRGMYWVYPTVIRSPGQLLLPHTTSHGSSFSLRFIAVFNLRLSIFDLTVLITVLMRSVPDHALRCLTWIARQLFAECVPQ